MARKLIVCLIAAVMMCSTLVFTGCSGSSSDADVVISESKYVAYINEIYANPGRYLEKSINLEGMFDMIDNNWWVYRNGPGCCGTDATCGFILTLDPANRPHKNDWVSVTGVLKMSSKSQYPYLKVTDIKVLSTRGAEKVENSYM